MPNERSVHNDDETDNSRISVVVLAGLPASGKSTLARKLEQRFNRHKNNVETLEHDEEIRRLIHIEYDGLEDNLMSSIGMEGPLTALIK